LPNPERDDRLQQLAAEEDRAGKGGGYADLKRRAWLDSVFCFDDLWNACAYDVVSTTWTPLTRNSVLKPRCKYPDPEKEPEPVERRYHWQHDEEAMAKLKADYLTPGGGLADLCVRDGAGRWADNPA